jgi:polyvinyl alcohol dehydrogenase (cytochrome)
MRQGYAGGGIWATPVVDPASAYAFVGTANPYSKFKGSIYDDAILKIDLDRHRKTFGRIVDVYRGSVDQWAEGIDQQPACDMFGDAVGTPPDAYSLTCFQFDIDFGGSPGLFHDSAGRLMIGEMQKSSEFHAVYADTMTRAWKVSLGPPIPPGTAGPLDSPAFDGKHVFIAGAMNMFALNPDDGSIDWVTPIPDLGQTPVPSKPVQVANGVVYYSEGRYIDAFDADTGQVLWTSVNADSAAGVSCMTSASSGLAIAHHLLIKNCATQLVAYRLPGGSQ